MELLEMLGSGLILVVRFVVAIAILVTVHEFGHFWVARRLGVKVLRFSIGFGRPLLKWRGRDRDRVEYVVAAIPLGGYVKMLDETEAEVPEPDRARAFNRQPLPVRFAVVLAGPIANFLLAVLAYWVMYMVGVQGLRPLVDQVEAGSLADAAGVRAGHEIVGVDGRATRTWQGVVESVIGAAMREGYLPLAVRDPSGREQHLIVDMSGVHLDELTEGRFLERLGIEPARARFAPVVREVQAGSPAEAADLHPGDRIVAVGGEAVDTAEQVIERVRARPGVALAVEVRRDGRLVRVEVVPAVRTQESAWGRLRRRVAEALGAKPAPAPTFGQIGTVLGGEPGAGDRFYALERYGPVEALGRGVEQTWEMSALTVRFIWKMLTFEVSVKNLSGPITIARYADRSFELGLATFLNFLAIVSVSLGILNLLPVPLLDGGHLLYYCIELLRGRPLSEEAQFTGQRLGIAMLVGLMGLAFYNDIARLLG